MKVTLKELEAEAERVFGASSTTIRERHFDRSHSEDWACTLHSGRNELRGISIRAVQPTRMQARRSLYELLRSLVPISR